MAAASPPANVPVPTIFETAFKNLKGSVTSPDASAFQSTTFEDVWKAAEEIEKVQRQKGNLQNLRRIEPFLKCLENYSRVIEVLCNGTPYLPWIWSPIKLMLQLASQYTSIFDKLLDAYRQIGEAMPQFGRLQGAFSDDENFRVVLGMVYSDILEFHQRAYKFFRRRSWHVFFASVWKSFECRFRGILRRLESHQQLLMREAAVIDVVHARKLRNAATIEAEELRATINKDIERKEKETRDSHLHDSIAWLNVRVEDYDDKLETLLQKRQNGTCEWVFEHPLFKAWRDDAHGEPILWVKGIPGAGKTILSTYVIHRFHHDHALSTTAYHICDSHNPEKSLLGEIFRNVTIQLLKSNLDLAPYIFENYANKGLAPSISRLRGLLEMLVGTITSSRIIVDGLDEYSEKDQRTILTELIALTKSSGGQCRVLFSNREGKLIDKLLGSKPTISLKDQHEGVSKDIEAYVHNNPSLIEFREDFGDQLIDQIERKIMQKADGMFLLVRLILTRLAECNSRRALEDAVERLPEGLNEAYGQILERLTSQLSEEASLEAIRILQWTACSIRTLKKYELQDAILFHTRGLELNEQTKLRDSFWEFCKPIIEEGPKGTINFVHYTAKEYLFQPQSAPNQERPFLYYHQAYYTLALGCSNYLNSSYCFSSSSSIDDDSLKIRVVKGYHGLHHYANEFWLQHVLQYAKREHTVEDDELHEVLDELQQFWKSKPGDAARYMKLDDTTSADAIEEQLLVLEDMPLAQDMGRDVLTFKKLMSQENYNHKEAQSLTSRETENDPTFFSEVSQRLQSIVQTLLECPSNDLPAGILPSNMDKFRSIYLDSAFICRYRDCARNTDGFSSSIIRDEHEKSHVKPLRCADPSCDFFSRGFTSKTGLLKHNRKYHKSPDEVDPPPFEPRKEPEPQIAVVPPPQPQPNVPVGQVESPPPPSPELDEEENVPRQSPPRQPRQSRAKRGMKVHACDMCPKVFTRAEGLRRHKLSHYSPKFSCDYNGCHQAFYREDLLARHINVRHTPHDVPGSPGQALHNSKMPISMSISALLNSNIDDPEEGGSSTNSPTASAPTQ